MYDAYTAPNNGVNILPHKAAINQNPGHLLFTNPDIIGPLNVSIHINGPACLSYSNWDCKIDFRELGHSLGAQKKGKVQISNWAAKDKLSASIIGLKS
jgi:hypothetical protein